LKKVFFNQSNFGLVKLRVLPTATDAKLRWLKYSENTTPVSQKYYKTRNQGRLKNELSLNERTLALIALKIEVNTLTPTLGRINFVDEGIFRWTQNCAFIYTNNPM